MCASLSGIWGLRYHLRKVLEAGAGWAGQGRHCAFCWEALWQCRWRTEHAVQVRAGPVPETHSLSQDLCPGCTKASSLVTVPSLLQRVLSSDFPSTPQLLKSQRSDWLKHSCLHASCDETRISAGQTNREGAKIAIGEIDFGHRGEFLRSSSGRLKGEVEPLWKFWECLSVWAERPTQLKARAVWERTLWSF